MEYELKFETVLPERFGEEKPEGIRALLWGNEPGDCKQIQEIGEVRFADCQSDSKKAMARIKNHIANKWLKPRGLSLKTIKQDKTRLTAI